MLLRGLVLLCLAAFALGDREVYLTPGGNWVSEVKSENYPENPVTQKNEVWKLSTALGSKIKLLCMDFRFVHEPEEPCKYGKMVFDDGSSRVEKCGVDYTIFIETKSNTLTVELVGKEAGVGLFECLAKAVTEPKDRELVELKPGQNRKFSFPDQEGVEQEKSWLFRAVPSDKLLTLRCDLALERPFEETGKCAKDVITLEGGTETVRLCGNQPLMTASTDHDIKLTAELFPTSAGRMDCIAEVEGDEPESESDFVSLEDSSEHGGPPGIKTTTCPCGMANKDSDRIFNGTVTAENEYPFMVSMRSSNGGGHFCGASVISPMHILTAAHCVSDHSIKNLPTPDSLAPTVGAHHLWENSWHGETKKLRVKQVFIPDQWFVAPYSLAGDIAILLLETPLTYNKYVSPVCLSPTPLPIVHKFIKAIGWGQTETGRSPDRLLDARVKVLDKDECNKNEKEICFKSGPSTSCFGDSGGPYVYLDPETNRYTQAGLASYVYGKCTGSYFIGTNTVYWYDWIQKIVQETSSYDVCRKID